MQVRYNRSRWRHASNSGQRDTTGATGRYGTTCTVAYHRSSGRPVTAVEQLENDICAAVGAVAARHGHDTIEVSVRVIMTGSGPHLFARAAPAVATFSEAHAGRTVEAVTMAAYRRTNFWLGYTQSGLHAVGAPPDTVDIERYVTLLQDTGFDAVTDGVTVTIRSTPVAPNQTRIRRPL
jgi:hypothetical protein